MQAAIDPAVVLKVVEDLQKVDDEWLAEFGEKIRLQGGRLTDGQWLVLKKMWCKNYPGEIPPWTME